MSKSLPTTAIGNRNPKIEFDRSNNARSAFPFSSLPKSKHQPDDPKLSSAKIINLDQLSVQRQWSLQSKRIIGTMKDRIDSIEKEKLETRSRILQSRKSNYLQARDKMWGVSGTRSASTAHSSNNQKLMQRSKSAFIPKSQKYLLVDDVPGNQCFSWYLETCYKSSEITEYGYRHYPKSSSSFSRLHSATITSAEIKKANANGTKILHEFRDSECSKRWKVIKGSSVSISKSKESPETTQIEDGERSSSPITYALETRISLDKLPIIESIPNELEEAVIDFTSISKNYRLQGSDVDISIPIAETIAEKVISDAIQESTHNSMELHAEKVESNDQDESSETTMPLTMPARDLRNSWRMEKPDSFLINATGISRRPSSTSAGKRTAKKAVQSSIHVKYKPIYRASSWKTPLYRHQSSLEFIADPDSAGVYADAKNAVNQSEELARSSLQRLHEIAKSKSLMSLKGSKTDLANSKFANYVSKSMGSLATGLNIVPVVPTTFHGNNNLNGYGNQISAIRMEGLDGTNNTASLSNNRTSIAARENARAKDELELFLFAESLCAGNSTTSVSELLATIDRYLYQKSLDPSNNGMGLAPTKASNGITDAGPVEWIQDSTENLGNVTNSLEAIKAVPIGQESRLDIPSQPIKKSVKWAHVLENREKEILDMIKGLDQMLNQRKEFSRRIEAESAADIINMED